MAATEMPPSKSFLPPPLSSSGADSYARSAPGRQTYPAPQFLVSLQDEVEHSHRRQAFWMSVLIHLVGLVAFINGAKFLTPHGLVVPLDPAVMQNRDYTLLVLPQGLQKNAPHTNAEILSDKDREATARHPLAEHKTTGRVLASGQKSVRAMSFYAPKPRPLVVRNSGVPPRHANEADVGPAPVLIHQGQPEMTQLSSATSAATPVLTAQAAAPVVGTPLGASRSRGGGASPEGLNASGPEAASQSNVDVMSDTMGVDFGPYLSRILHAVRTSWYNRIPESARAPLMKKGKVSIQFDILRTGQITAIEVVGTSGDPSLDGAAIAGINGSSPFPPLPPQFQGQYLALRFHFFYNPDTNDLR